MKATDILLGTEYCETGPLAYGVEPHVASPRRVKFVDLTPGWGWVKKYLVKDTDYGPRPVVDGPAHIANPRKTEFRHVASYTDRIPPLANKPVGFEAYTFTPSKGFYLADIWNDTQQEWYRGLAQPAGIHRTWAEFADKEAEKAKARVTGKVATAPRDFEKAMREALLAAAYAGHDDAFIYAWVHANYPKAQATVIHHRERVGL
jgi:hypothetical protein